MVTPILSTNLEKRTMTTSVIGFLDYSTDVFCICLYMKLLASPSPCIHSFECIFKNKACFNIRNK